LQDQWVAIDFETASARGRPCQIAAVRVCDGVVEQEFSTFIFQESADFDSFNVWLHGITPQMVIGAPAWPVARQQLLEFGAGLPFVAHNAPFDVGVIRDACDVYSLEWPSLRYACTLGISRQVWPGLRSYSLRFLCAELDIGAAGEDHEALHDARLAAGLLKHAMEERRASGLLELLDSVRIRLGEIAPGAWFGSLRRQLTARDVLEATDASTADPEAPFFGKTVVFTGELAMPRRIVWQLVAASGGVPSNSVSKKTDYLVCGYQDLVKLARGQSKSSKFRRAEVLQADGQPLEFLAEKDFFRML
jgi:DNA polymerase-3 subunit epsilon